MSSIKSIELTGHQAGTGEVTIHQVDKPMGHDVVRLFPQAWGDMFTDGVIDTFVLPFSTYWATIYAERVFNDQGAREPLGFIHYRTDTDSEWWVCSSYVLPLYRRCGIYTGMFNAMKELATKAGVLRIGGGTSVLNTGMQAAYAATGRRPHSQTWHYDLRG